MLYGLPGFVQEAAVTALGMAEQSEASMREYCNRRREILYAGLKDVPGNTRRAARRRACSC